MVGLNTMFKKRPEKQVTSRTSKEVEKQLDYILSDRKHHKWSRDAEAYDTIHMGSDHRCVVARFEIPKDKEKSKLRKTKAPSIEQNSARCDDEKQQKYLDLQQRIKEMDSRQGKRKKQLKQIGGKQQKRRKHRQQRRKSSKKAKQQHWKVPQHLKSKKKEEKTARIGARRQRAKRKRRRKMKGRLRQMRRQRQQ